MELIATSDQQLRHLGYHDPDLAPYFAGVFPSDRLPARPVDERPRAYMVNIDINLDAFVQRRLTLTDHELFHLMQTWDEEEEEDVLIGR